MHVYGAHDTQNDFNVRTTYGTIISSDRFMANYNSDPRLRHSFTTRPAMRGHVAATVT